MISFCAVCLSVVIGIPTGIDGAITTSLPIIAAVGFVLGKMIFSGNIVLGEGYKSENKSHI